MSFTARASTAVFTTLQPGEWEVFAQDPQPVTNGFDVLNVVFMADFRDTPKTALEIVAMFPQGMRFGTKDFWLRDARPACVGGNVWRVEARFEGRISASKPVHVALMTSTNSDFISVTAPTGVNVGATTYTQRWLPFPITLQPGATLGLTIREGAPGFEYSYFLKGSKPRTSLVGLGGLSGSPRIAPPVYFDVRRFPWANFTSQSWRINIPAGFVLDDLRSDQIAGAEEEVHWVTELWSYVPLYRPQT